MKILIISTCKEKLHELEFVKPIEKILSQNNMNFTTINYQNLSQNYLNNYDKIIITGTSFKDNEFLEDLKKFSWINNLNKPILGICAGMHLIGLTFKGKLIDLKEIGEKRINFKKEFLGLDKKQSVYLLHGKQINFEKLNVFEIFSQRVDSIYAVKHKSKEIYGISFHPEVKNPELIKNFCKF